MSIYHVPPKPLKPCSKRYLSSLFLFWRNLLHCIRDYTTSKNIWYALGFISFKFVSNPYIVNCFKCWLASSSSNFFVVGVWWSWRNRNSSCFFNVSISTYHHGSSQLITHFQHLLSKITSSPPTYLEDILVQWNSSNHICTIINVDGSCL